MHSLRLILSDLKYFAPCWVFASINILTGTWVLYLPHIKSKLSLSDADIGLSLFCFGLGILLSIPLVPTVSRKVGVGRSTQIAVIVFAILFNLPLITPSYHTLLISLFLVGFASGFTDIAMNALVTNIEKNNQKNFMSAAHGFFSLGGFIGAGVGILLMPIIGTPHYHMVIVSVIIILTNLYLGSHYNSIYEEPISNIQDNSKVSKLKPLYGIAIVAFIIMCNEGAVEHWSTLFLNEIVSVSAEKAGLGFIAFSICMTIGRFFGDSISQRLGSNVIILLGLLIAFIAYLFIISIQLILAIFGFGLLGIGLSVIVPELFRIAGRSEHIAPSVGISFVSGIGFAGFLVGPFIIGFLSDIKGLVFSYIVLGGSIALAIAICSLVLVPKK